MHNADSNTSTPEQTRARWMEDALSAMSQDLEEDKFTAGLGHFREALCLSQGYPQLKTLADSQASEQAEKLLPRNWRVAQSLILEAASVSPVFAPSAGLREKLRLARYEEVITGALHYADRARFDGTIEQARTKLTELMAAYPDEPRLGDRLAALDHPPPMTPAPDPPDPRRALIKTEPGAIAKSLINQTNLDVWQNRGAIAKSLWQSSRNLVALATTTAMLGAAGFLVWHHFSSPVTQARDIVPAGQPKLVPALNLAPVSATPVLEPALIPPDEGAWQFVKTSDSVAALRSFLTAYPASSHAYRARLRLAALEWSKLNKTNPTAIEAFLRLHPRTPYKAQAEQFIAIANAKVADQDAIVEAVRAYRQALPDGDSQIEPGNLRAALVNGDEATVVTDATAPVTYFLVRRDGIWQVQSVR